ncbi:MAG: hypothetical protein HKM93_05000 [Desulfobacteraceae bacterium]|nr:hypothetical protein [Desulfobacteraceae bacterium]
MARVVETVLPAFKDKIQYRRVITKDLAGALRYEEISKHLGRPAPVPAICINGELVFDTTPGVEELQGYLDDLLTPSV